MTGSESSAHAAGMSDIDLMLRAREGDDTAFGVLIRRHQDALFRFFRSMGLGDDSEDAVQETFLRLHRYRGRYEPRAAFRTFMYLLARQVCCDAFRKRLRRREMMESVQREAEAADAGSGADIGRSDRLALAEAVLNELPEAMRMVVVMSLYQGLRYEEIAGALDVPVGTVKSRMFHAMLKLKEALHARTRRA